MPLDQSIRARFVAGGTRGEGRIQDVSKGGFFVRSALLLPDGDPIEAVLETPGGERAVIQGVVRWNTATVANRSAGFGVRVLRAGPDYRALLVRLLAGQERPEGQRDGRPD